MKVFLVVSEGAHQGKRIPITKPEFVIGRDPQCQLRPASPMISRRHCAVVVRSGKLFLQDFGSTNGVKVNGQRVTGEVPLANGDQIRVDPLAFALEIEALAPSAKKPAAAPAASTDDDSIAAMWMDIQDDGTSSTADPGAETTSNTVMEMPALSDPNSETRVENKPAPASKDPKKTATGDTASAAKLLLDKYTKRKIV